MTRMCRTLKARLTQFNFILWVVWRHQHFLSIGRHDYKKAELESVYSVRHILKERSLGSRNYGRSLSIKGKGKGFCSKSWQQAGEECTEMRDIEKEED